MFGNSGGKDSATVIAMATKALGKDKVLTVAMPCNSVESDLEDAKLAADTFGVKLLNVDISTTFEDIKEQIENKITELGFKELCNESKINMKPRLRMTTLYSIAQTMGYLVIGTGNLCEIMVRLYYKMGR